MRSEVIGRCEAALSAYDSQPRDALGDRRMRHEHVRGALRVVERAHGVEGLGRRRGVELDELGRAIEAEQRVGEVMGVDEPCGRGVRRVLAPRRKAADWEKTCRHCQR